MQDNSSPHVMRVPCLAFAVVKVHANGLGSHSGMGLHLTPTSAIGLHHSTCQQRTPEVTCCMWRVRLPSPAPITACAPATSSCSHASSRVHADGWRACSCSCTPRWPQPLLLACPLPLHCFLQLALPPDKQLQPAPTAKRMPLAQASNTTCLGL